MIGNLTIFGRAKNVNLRRPNQHNARRTNSVAITSVVGCGGQYAVLQTLTTGVWSVYEIVSNANAFKQSCEVLAAKHAAGIPLEIVDNDRLQQLTGSSEHQGIAVRLGPFSDQSRDSLSTRLQLFPPSDNVPLVVIYDRLQDGFNFGATLR